MAGLTGTVPALHAALSAARSIEQAQVDDGLRQFGMTGVQGEPEVGTTSVIEATIRASGQPSIRLDLDAVASDSDVAWTLAHGLARQVIGAQALSLLGAPSIAPAGVRRAYVVFAEQVGERLAAFAIADAPIDDISVSDVLNVIGRVFDAAAVPPILWVDHLQAPALTPRHPVDVDALLWNIRSLRHRTELPIILSGSSAATPTAHGPAGAFYGDGSWVTLTRPTLKAWYAVADALPEGGPSDHWIAEMAEITNRHPATMLLSLALRHELAEHSHTPLDLWQLMLALDDGLVGRANQHARSLHRLGSTVLNRIAHGVRPYEGARTKAEQNERNRAVRRLYEGGLITQPRPRTWEVTNPLLAGRLRRNMPFSSAEARPLEAPDPRIVSAA